MKPWQIKEWILSHKLYVVIGVAVLILIFYFASGSIGGVLDRWHASRFDKKQQAYEKQITDLQAKYDAAVKRGDEFERQAILKDAEGKKLKELIDAKGGQIEKAADELEKKIEDAKRDAGSCAVVVDQRACVCAKLAALGYQCN